MSTSTAVDSSPAEPLACRLAALVDPVRLRIITVLAAGGQCVCGLREQVPVPANLLSHHVRVLPEAGLVTATGRGRWIDYRLDSAGFATLWAQASGVPLPWRPATTAAWCGPGCTEAVP